MAATKSRWNFNAWFFVWKSPLQLTSSSFTAFKLISWAKLGRIEQSGLYYVRYSASDLNGGGSVEVEVYRRKWKCIGEGFEEMIWTGGCGARKLEVKRYNETSSYVEK